MKKLVRDSSNSELDALKRCTLDSYAELLDGLRRSYTLLSQCVTLRTALQMDRGEEFLSIEIDELKKRELSFLPKMQLQAFFYFEPKEDSPSRSYYTSLYLFLQEENYELLIKRKETRDLRINRPVDQPLTKAEALEQLRVCIEHYKKYIE